MIGMLCYPMPISGYLGQVEMGEVSVSGDPIYDKYQSSDLLYNGGQITLPGENGETLGSEPDTENSTVETVPTAPESTENEGETPGSTDQVIETHLPTVITGKRYTKLQLQNFKYSTSIYSKLLNC